MSQTLRQTTIHVFEGWHLTAEGAAIHCHERTAVIADVHLGYEWARGAAGDCVPSHSLDETLQRLDRVLSRAPIARLIVAGDLVESARPCHRTDEDVRQLRDWLQERGVAMIVLLGNHDRARSPVASSAREAANALSQSYTVADWTIGHGDRPVAGARTITGHLHPVMRTDGFAAPCFLVAPGRIILPAFSLNAAGLDVGTAALPRDWRSAGFQCLASTGDELLDFGSLSGLRRLSPGGRATRRPRG